MAEDTTKKYPLATAEISKIMGISDTEAAAEAPAAVAAPSSGVLNLPVVETDHAATPAAEAPHPTHVEPSFQKRIDEAVREEYQDAVKNKFNPVLVIRLFGPYVAVFAIGIFLYFFFFTTVDFTSWFKSRPAAKSVQDTALQQLQRQNADAYNSWIRGFYYSVSEASILDANADNSGNGLTNFQKFLLNLNPKSYDTMGLGMADSEALAQGINPLSGQALTDKQKEILEKYFDMETIQNKLTIAKLHSTQAGQVAGINTGVSGGDPLGSYSQPTSTQLSYLVQASEQVINAADLDINTDIPARLEIPSIGVNVPIMWSDSPENFDEDLRSGVVHYPGTALPGQVGTSYISGHSSNYIWAKGEYNRIFSKINNVPDNASFKITVVQKNGKDAILHYVVTGRKEFSATDQAQFANAGKSVVALSTCWPINTTQKRLVLFGELSQVDR